MISSQAGQEQAATDARTAGPATTLATTPAAGGAGPEPLYGGTASRRVTVRDLAAAKRRGEHWPMLTAALEIGRAHV